MGSFRSYVGLDEYEMKVSTEVQMISLLFIPISDMVELFVGSKSCHELIPAATLFTRRINCCCCSQCSEVYVRVEEAGSFWITICNKCKISVRLVVRV